MEVFKVKTKIYLVAHFKSCSQDLEKAFKRCHLLTFYTSLEDAKLRAISGFSDEAGWYNGILIEEREEGNPFFHGQRVFYLFDFNTKKFNEIPEPDQFKDCLNLI